MMIIGNNWNQLNRELERQEIKDNLQMGVGAEFMESRFSTKLSLCIFFVVEALVFMLLYDHFSKWYYPALIALIPAILIPVLIEVIRRKRRGY
ncbi:MAG: hypothetical protein II694_01330 [Lachnospiraceae bacterium]|nr:hypothetical protein [Lachnospiraceae bacterium]